MKDELLISESGCISAVCRQADCGLNGKCMEFNETHYECVCNLFYDGPRCNIFKPIEHAAKFNGDAFIELSADEFPHLTSEKNEIVQLRFKTEHPNGIIFWQGQQPDVSVVGEDYISLGLTNGYLHYSYELGGGAANMVSPIRLNDGNMHTVRLERRGRRGILQVDNDPALVGMSSGILAMLNAEGNIFIGGVPDIRHSTGGLHHQNFVGCIADVALNGEKVDLMGTAIDGKNVRPCEEWISPKRWLKLRRRT
ncbi:unnamed protein product [Auanema sp. JU1783]|nr:unnamed protein product [Auanema sp. JU1783]